MTPIVNGQADLVPKRTAGHLHISFKKIFISDRLFFCKMSHDSYNALARACLVRVSACAMSSEAAFLYEENFIERDRCLKQLAHHKNGSVIFEVPPESALSFDQPPKATMTVKLTPLMANYLKVGT